MDAQVALTLLSVAGKFLGLSGTVAEYAKDFMLQKDQTSCDKLEAALNACGYTLQRYFETIAKIVPNQELAQEASSSAAFVAQVEVIKNSNDFSDAEKCERLHKLYEEKREYEKIYRQKNIEYNNQKMLQTTVYVALGASVLLITVACSANYMKNGEILPKYVKTTVQGEKSLLERVYSGIFDKKTNRALPNKSSDRK